MSPVRTDPKLENKPAPGVSYFTPLQEIPSGTALDVENAPKLFKPLKIRGITLHNRIGLSPLCQYSAQDGHLTDWHFSHLGGIISRGPGLSFVEATAVTPEGRITPEDSGLWKDSQMEPLKRIVEFAHSQNQLIGIQLAHGGRKATTVAPWLSAAGDVANEDFNGWPDAALGPSAIAYNDRHALPKAMTLEDIESFKQSYVAAVRRALAIGFDAIEIHNAHGYLLHSFLSPASNQRTDQYGGSFENRTRLTLELVELVRKELPDNFPLFLRVSATDWLEDSGIESWTVDQTVRLAPLLAERGVDLLDVSSAGLHDLQNIRGGPAYQAPFAAEVKKKVGDTLLVSSVGTINEGTLANKLVEEDGLDMVFAGRWFQQNPGLVWTWADDLGIEINVANQIRWAFAGRGKPAKKVMINGK